MIIFQKKKLNMEWNMETITLRMSVYQIEKIIESKEAYLEYCERVMKQNDEKLAMLISEKKDTENANRLIKIEMMKAKTLEL